jgi:LysR family cys regulon transcriptional activator
MNLQQLRYLVAIVDHGLNISDAAEVLFTSQPGISKQIRQLEDELGVAIFVRRGRALHRIDRCPGKLVVERARRLVIEAAGLKRIGDEHRAHDEGSLTIATTHTQARYVLPPTIKQFTERFPKVRLLLHQGNPVQVAQFVAKAEADIGIATESLADNPEPGHTAMLQVEPLRDHAARPSAGEGKATDDRGAGQSSDSSPTTTASPEHRRSPPRSRRRD